MVFTRRPENAVIDQMFEINRIIDTDSYKASHWLQYPPNTTRAFFYLESRGSDRNWNETVFFGLQYILKRYFASPFTQEMVEEAKEVITAHGLPFNYAGWSRLLEKYEGRLPLRIRAVPEGSIIPLHNVLMTVETTDAEFAWLASWFETQLMRIWYAITVATQSYQIKKDVYKYLIESSDDPDGEILYKVHDFGARGVSSQETAAIGGAAHLVNFLGTDTMAALLLHREFYHASMAGFSIPAAEHSTVTSWGRDAEVESYRNLLRNFAKPGSLLAVVSDSWNIYNAVEHLWGEQLRL
jgi:nicotinamide phosphoribosyltransferase